MITTHIPSAAELVTDAQNTDEIQDSTLRATFHYANASQRRDSATRYHRSYSTYMKKGLVCRSWCTKGEGGLNAVSTVRVRAQLWEAQGLN